MLPGSWWPSARCVLGGGRGRGTLGSLSRGLGSRTGHHAPGLHCSLTLLHGGSGPNTRGTVTACSRVPSAKEMWGQANAEPRRQPCGRVRGRFVGLRELHGDSDSCSGSWRDPRSLSTKTGNTLVPGPAAPSLGKSLPPPGAPRCVSFLSLGSRRILEACEISSEGRGARCVGPRGPARPARDRLPTRDGGGLQGLEPSGVGALGAPVRAVDGGSEGGLTVAMAGAAEGKHPVGTKERPPRPRAMGSGRALCQETRWVLCFGRGRLCGLLRFFDGRKAPGARTEPPPHFAHGKAGLRGASAGAALKSPCPWLSRRDSSSDEDSKPCGAKRAGGEPRPARPCAVSARRTHGDGRAGPRPGGGRRGRGPGRHSQAGGPRGEDALSSRTLRGPRRLARGRPSAALSRSQFRSPTADRGLDTCDGTFQK